MKRFLFFLIFLHLSFSIFSFSQDDIQIFTLENGLKIYFLEDASSPTVRAELCINAGFTNQNRKNSSLFHLYARLAHGEISNDCVRFVADVAPSSAEKALLNLSTKLKLLRPTDSELSAAFNILNQELEEYSKSIAGFINTAIDSKLFPENPWTRESGCDWNIFRQSSNDEIRAQLQSISDTYYIPANTKLFVNGNITQTALLAIVKKYFSPFTGRAFEPQKDEDAKILHEELQNSPEQKSSLRKFLLIHDDFSDEMSQLVLQYQNISSDEADVLASTWNRDGSCFKKLLTRQKPLYIPGDEYVSVSSAQEKHSSRLIIQSLLGKAQLSPASQADLFLSMSRDNDVFATEEIQAALRQYRASFLRLSESSSETMQALSRFISLHEGKSPAPLADFFSREKIFSEIKVSDLQDKIKGEEPYVFLLVNTAVYQKYTKEFKNAGFQIINQKESRWFEQDFYKKLIKESEKKSEEKKSLLEEIALSARRFISNSLSEYSFFELKNKIPVTIKENKSSNTAVLSITIAGGQLLFAKKVPGLAEVLAGSIAVNIRKQLDLFAANNAIEGYYTVTSETKATHSIITVTCFAREIDFAIQAAYTALVYCDISPVTADGVTYDERTRWRLKSGNTAFQLLCEAMRILYKDSEYPDLYQDTKDKPDESLNFTKILEGYPILLDSSRFSLIITGNVAADEKLRINLDESFGNLITIEENASRKLALPQVDFSKTKQKEKRLKLRHLFLTDISKDKAGPRPAVLVPTTKFLDPVLFCLPAPDLAGTDCALFNALLIELAKRMEKELAQKSPETKVLASLPENEIPFARLTITNVESTNAVDTAYKKSISSIKKELARQTELKTEGVIDLEKTDLLAGLENNWIMEVLSQAASQTGTARLIQSGKIQDNPQLYLNQYEAVSKAEAEDYMRLAEKYLTESSPLRLYSKDSPK